MDAIEQKPSPAIVIEFRGCRIRADSPLAQVLRELADKPPVFDPPRGVWYPRIGREEVPTTPRTKVNHAS